MIGSSTTRVLSRLLVLITAVVVVAVLYLAKIVFLPLAFAILFAFLLAPLITMLERIRLPRLLAILIVILGFGLMLGSIGWVVVMQLVDVADELPTYRANVAEKVEAMHSPQNSAFSRARREVEHLNEQLGLANASPAPDLHYTDKKALGSSPEQPIHVQEVARPNGRLDQLGGIVEPIVTAFLTVVFTFFVLLEREDLRNRVIRLTGDTHLHLTTEAMNDASRRISRYFSLQFLVNTVYGLITFAALHFLGLPHAFLFGALATLLRFIPYIGAPVAALLPTVYSLAMFHGWTNSLYILGTFVLLEVVTANYAEPRLYGKHTGLSSLAILIAAAFWTLVWGPVGLVLSVPLTVCLVVVGRHVPYLEFLTVLLGDQPPIPPSARFYQRLLARDEREAEEILTSCLKDNGLAGLYDSVVIPALNMSEEDRNQNNLESSAVRFIYHTTRALIEDLGQRDSLEAENQRLEQSSGSDGTIAASARVLCVPVQDEADELGAIMLAQVLGSGGLHATAIPARRAEEVLAMSSAEKPDVIFLSGMPPFAMAHSRRLYRSLRARHPGVKIMIGIWNYTEDETKAAQDISRGEDDHISMTMTEALAKVNAFLGISEPSTPLNEGAGMLLPVAGEGVA